MTALTTLNQALHEMADARVRTPCAGSDSWISDDHEDRQWAIARCAPCPLLDPCRAVVLEEKPTFGVWAGVDLTKKTRRSQPRKARA